MDVVTKVEGTPAGGYRFVSDIVATNSRQFKPDESALDVAIEMVSSHTGELLWWERTMSSWDSSMKEM